ncbi:unnamed protein product [Camellia sinensis]
MLTKVCNREEGCGRRKEVPQLRYDACSVLSVPFQEASIFSSIARVYPLDHTARLVARAKFNSKSNQIESIWWECEEEEEEIEMALNPQLFPNGMPVPFVNEMFVLARDGVEYEVDKIPGANGGKVKAKGTIFLSNIRMVFVANKPVGNFIAFDMPLEWKLIRLIIYKECKEKRTFPVGLSERDEMEKSPGSISGLHIHDEKFNQPIFLCNNISGLVEPVIPDDQHRALFSTHAFKILFKEGGCGTFVPLFFNLIKSVRQYSQQYASREEQRADPLQAAQTPVDEMMRHAYVDPNDPTRIFLQQPTSESQLRRRTYHSQPAEHSI